MRWSTRVALLAAGLALAWLSVALGPRDDGPRGSVAERVSGTFAHVAAAWEWTRFDAAWAQGDAPRAWAHAARALELAPSDAGGWIYLAHHAVYERASPRRSLAPAERRRWVEAGLELLARGERLASQPGPVAFKAGVVYLSLASEDDADRALPISRAEAWTRAAEAFERAAAAGEPVAAEAADLAREEARAAGG